MSQDPKSRPQPTQSGRHRLIQASSSTKNNQSPSPSPSRAAGPFPSPKERTDSSRPTSQASQRSHEPLSSSKDPGSSKTKIKVHVRHSRKEDLDKIIKLHASAWQDRAKITFDERSKRHFGSLDSSGSPNGEGIVYKTIELGGVFSGFVYAAWGKVSSRRELLLGATNDEFF